MKHTRGRTQGVQEAPIVKLIADSNVPTDAVDLGQGVPFYGPPKEAILAATGALDKESGYRYSPDAGIASLCDAIVKKLASENGVEVDSGKNIMVTAGANQAFANTILCITRPGDHVLVLSPYYFNHVMAIQLAGCKPIIVDTDRDYQPLIQHIGEKITKRVKAIVLVSPNNPTGAVYSRDAIKEVDALCAENGIYLVSDETYEHFVYDDTEFVSALEVDKRIEHTISLFSFSKSYGMSGYRIGYAVFPASIYDEMLKVQDTLTICAPSALQVAAEAAMKLGAAYPKQFIPRIEKVRRIFIGRLARLGSAEMPITKGSYYFLLRLRTKKSDWGIAKRLIEEHGVITIPGEVFGTRYPSLRVAYANLD
ncbi:aminotransferase class I/II-fold pyridoxal phosphate-dependent enzyme, partial [bacterium]